MPLPTLAGNLCRRRMSRRGYWFSDVATVFHPYVFPTSTYGRPIGDQMGLVPPPDTKELTMTLREDFSTSPAKELSLLYQAGDLWRDHFFPARVAFADLGQHVAGENWQAGFIISAQALYA